MSTVFFLIFIGLIGISVKVATKIRTLQKRTASEKVDIIITPMKYLLDEWYVIFTSVVAVIVAAAFYYFKINTIPEKYATIITNWNIGVFLVIGFAGSELLLKMLGVTEKAANKAVDEALNKIP